jgi:Tfp pilus assembly protein PilF
MVKTPVGTPRSSGDPAPSRLLFVLALLTIGTFAPAIRGPLIFDDYRAIQFNQTLTDFGTALHPPAESAVAGRPVTNITLALDYWLNDRLGIDQHPIPAARNRTIVYHATNIIIHLLAGLLLFGIIRRTLGARRVHDDDAHRWSGLPLIVTAIWMVHPLQADAVDYIVQRTELLASLCYLATLYCSIRAWDAPRQGERPLRWYLLGVVACALGMGAKEIMVTAPLIVLLYDRAFQLTSWKELALPAFRARRWFYASLFATLLILLVLQASTPRATAGFGQGMTSMQYLVSQGWAIPHYLWSALVPTGLALDYGAAAIPFARGFPGLLVLATIGLLTLLAWRYDERWASVAFLGTAFFVLLAPSSSVIPITTEIAADRRMYLALAPVLLAICLLVEIAGARLARVELFQAPSPTSARWPRVVGFAVVGVVALMSFQRSRLYADPEAIWRDARSKVPQNARAWLNAGIVAETAGHPEEADSLYSAAVAHDSSYADAIVRVAFNRAEGHRYAEARDVLRHLPLGNANVSTLRGLAQALMQSADTNGAIVMLQRLADDSSVIQPLIDLTTIYDAAGRDSEEVAVLARADHLFPHHPEILFHLGAVVLRLHHADQAEQYLEQVSSLVPDNAAVLTELGRAKAALGKRSEATALFTKALKLDPSDSVARAALARPQER